MKLKKVEMFLVSQGIEKRFNMEIEADEFDKIPKLFEKVGEDGVLVLPTDKGEDVVIRTFIRGTLVGEATFEDEHIKCFRVNW